MAPQRTRPSPCTARRPRRPRPGRRAGRPGRPGRRQGAAGSRRRGLRAGTGAAVCPSQGTQRARSSPRTRPARREGPAAQGVGSRTTSSRSTGSAARRRARPLPPRRGSVAAGGHGGDAHPHPPRGPWQAQEHAREHEPDRVDDRHRPAQQPQRQALAVRRHGLRWTAAGMLEAEPSSAGSSATATSPSSPSPSSRPRSHSTRRFTPRPRRTPASPSPCNHHTRPPPRTSTANGTTSALERPTTRPRRRILALHLDA